MPTVIDAVCDRRLQRNAERWLGLRGTSVAVRAEYGNRLHRDMSSLCLAFGVITATFPGVFSSFKKMAKQGHG